MHYLLSSRLIKLVKSKQFGTVLDRLKRFFIQLIRFFSKIMNLFFESTFRHFLLSINTEH